MVALGRRDRIGRALRRGRRRRALAGRRLSVGHAGRQRVRRPGHRHAGGAAGAESETARLALGVGLLGGFTTFSAFSLETVRLDAASTRPRCALCRRLGGAERRRLLGGLVGGADMRTVETVEVGVDDGEARIDRWLRRRYPQLTPRPGRKAPAHRPGARRRRARESVRPRRRPAKACASRRCPTRRRARRPARFRARTRTIVRSLVIHRDDDVIVLNKPHGLAVQGGTNTTRHLDGLLDGLKFDAEKKPKLVHRLDRDTSGCLVLARHPRAAAFLGEAFRDRDTDKIYWAIVVGSPRPKVGELRSWMRKAPGPARRRPRNDAARRADGRRRRARRHPIRRALAKRRSAPPGSRCVPSPGAPTNCASTWPRWATPSPAIPNTNAIAPRPTISTARLMLHARALRLPHPSGGELNVTAPLPRHMRAAFNLLGFEERDARDPFAPFEGTR